MVQEGVRKKLLLDSADLVCEGIRADTPNTHRTSTNGLHSVLGESQDGAAGTPKDDRDRPDVHVPMELERRGGRKKIFLPSSPDAPAHVGPPRLIMAALGRAGKPQLASPGTARALGRAIFACCGKRRRPLYPLKYLVKYHCPANPAAMP